MDELIGELRELCAIEGRPLTVGERARTKIAMSEAAAALEAAREDAEKWRHARRILTVEDIETSQDMFNAFGVEGDEHENRKADAAIDQARGKGVAEVGNG